MNVTAGTSSESLHTIDFVYPRSRSVSLSHTLGAHCSCLGMVQRGELRTV